MSIWKLVLLGVIVVIASGGELVSGQTQKKEEKGYELKLKLLVAKGNVPPETLTDIQEEAGKLLEKLKPKITLAGSKSAITGDIAKDNLNAILDTNKEDDINLYVVIKDAGKNLVSWGKSMRKGRVCDSDLLKRALVVTLKEKEENGETSIDTKKTGKRLAVGIAKKLGGAKRCGTKRKVKTEVENKVDERAQKAGKGKWKKRCSKGIKVYIETFTGGENKFCLNRAK